MSKDIFHWVYVSKALSSVDEGVLDLLLSKARIRNAALELTGLLIYADNRFMQILEGPRENVDSMSKTISKDERHTDIDTLRFEYKEHRDFANWRMAFARPGDNRYPSGFVPLLENIMSTNSIVSQHSESYFFIDAFRRDNLGK